MPMLMVSMSQGRQWAHTRNKHDCSIMILIQCAVQVTGRSLMALEFACTGHGHTPYGPVCHVDTSGLPKHGEDSQIHACQRRGQRARRCSRPWRSIQRAVTNQCECSGDLSCRAKSSMCTRTANGSSQFRGSKVLGKFMPRPALKFLASSPWHGSYEHVSVLHTYLSPSNSRPQTTTSNAHVCGYH